MFRSSFQARRNTQWRENIGEMTHPEWAWEIPSKFTLKLPRLPRQNVFKLTSYSSNRLVSDSKKLFMIWVS